MKPLVLSFLLFSFTVSECQKKNDGPHLASAPEKVAVSPTISEASGIADSKTHPGYLWVMEDGGNPVQLILLGHDGQVKAELPIMNASNRDWEDLVLAGNHLYIGDIGDNDQKHGSYTIYRFAEPALGAKSIPQVEKIRFKYPDKSHDAEAFLVDPVSGDLFLFTKRDTLSKVFRLGANYSVTAENTATEMGTLPYNAIVSAALSPDGSVVYIKTYNKIYRYTRAAGQSIADAVKGKPTEMPYQQEPQGEAICFRQDGKGYFTLSEKLFGGDVYLYYYKLK